MRLALFSPYGSFHREAGLLYLVANYLDKQGGEVVQLRCDGALSACGRDKKHIGGRSPFACLQCLGEQSALSQWAGVRSRDVSSFIAPEDVTQSSKWISSVAREELDRLEFRGIRLWEMCSNEFAARWGAAQVSSLTPTQEQSVRALFVSYVHAVVASERFLASWKPTLSFAISQSDLISNAYLSQLRRSGGEAAIFTFNSQEESIVVESLHSGAKYTTTLILPEITEMRADPRTWAPELAAIVNELLSFLGHGADLIPGQV